MPGSLLAFVSFSKVRASSLVLGHLWALQAPPLRESEQIFRSHNDCASLSLNTLCVYQTPREGPICLSPRSSQDWSLWVVAADSVATWAPPGL